LAAFFAISDRFLADIPSALALPPMRPNATGAAFLPSSVVMSSISPVAIGDHDGVADGVGGTFFTLRASGHQ
jgi:hypothetical protein